MDRFNSNEILKRSFNDEARDIVYSDLNNEQKVKEIIKVQQNSFVDGQESLIKFFKDSIDGVVFIDRSFIEKMIESVNLPIDNEQ